MPRDDRNAFRRALAPAAVLSALLVAAPGASAQGADRERAQMMQLQQQLQRLEHEKSDLQSKAAQQGEELKKRQGEADAAHKDLARVRAESGARAKEVEALTGDLAAAREALTAARAQIEQLTKTVEGKDASLATAARLHREQEQAQALLTARLMAQTSRGDLCETKHQQAVSLATSLIDAYEKDRLRLCEPITGIWRVREEDRIQKLRDRLYESRLDVPIAKSEKPESAPAAQ